MGTVRVIYRYLLICILLPYYYDIYFYSDEEIDDGTVQMQKNNEQLNIGGGNPFLDVPILSNAVEYKKGYVMRKCCYEANAKRSEFLLILSFVYYLSSLLVFFFNKIIYDIIYYAVSTVISVI